MVRITLAGAIAIVVDNCRILVELRRPIAAPRRLEFISWPSMWSAIFVLYSLPLGFSLRLEVAADELPVGRSVGQMSSGARRLLCPFYAVLMNGQ
jgi:hypothetical protein